MADVTLTTTQVPLTGTGAKRCHNPVLCAWLEKFSQLRSTNSYISHYLLSYFIFFQLNTLKGTAKVPAVDLLRVF